MKFLRQLIKRIIERIRKEEKEYYEWLDSGDENSPEEDDNQAKETDFMSFTGPLLKKIFPPCKEPDIWAEELNNLLPKYDIVTIKRVAAFLAQTGHESAYYNVLSENLNYSAEALQRVFRRYFPTPELAAAYARNPRRIASRVYANRMGNGDELSEDGWRYRGRGIIQITGKNNYRACSLALFGDDTLLNSPDWLIDPIYALKSACWFWDTNNLNTIADSDNFELLTRRINGGLNGLPHRLEIYTRALKVLSQ